MGLQEVVFAVDSVQRLNQRFATTDGFLGLPTMSQEKLNEAVRVEKASTTPGVSAVATRRAQT